MFSYITLQHVPSEQAQLRYLVEASRVLAGGGQMAIQIRGNTLAARLLDWGGHLKHLTQRRRTLHRAWRGARISTSEIRDALAPGLEVEVVRSTPRHRWIVAIKPVADRQ